MKSRCAAHVAVKEVRGELIDKCLGTNHNSTRGICSNCFNYLVELGELKVGDKFPDYPEWLQELIRDTDREDHRDTRHPVDEYNDDLDGHNTATKLYLGTKGCYKARRMNTSIEIISLKSVH